MSETQSDVENKQSPLEQQAQILVDLIAQARQQDQKDKLEKDKQILSQYGNYSKDDIEKHFAKNPPPPIESPNSSPMGDLESATRIAIGVQFGRFMASEFENLADYRQTMSPGEETTKVSQEIANYARSDSNFKFLTSRQRAEMNGTLPQFNTTLEATARVYDQCKKLGVYADDLSKAFYKLSSGSEEPDRII